MQVPQASREPRARISIVMPAFNEEANIGRAVLRAEEVARRHGAEYEVVVVDDGSADTTSERAATGPGVRVIRHPRNLGYGAALRTGLRASQLDLVFFTDADNQFDLDEIDRLLALIGTADVVVGYRSRRRDRAVRRLVAAAWNRLVRMLFRIPVRDVDCAFKLFRSDVLEGIDLKSTGAMISTELIIRLMHAGRRIAEVEVSHRPRRSGKASGLSPKVVTRALVELVRMYPELSRLSRDARRRPPTISPEGR
jgi:glycosyltransferase involved in cell wall biosynthesis